MSGEDASREGPRTPHEAQRLSTPRLLLVVVLFFALAAYSIWNSDRFQTLLQGVSQARLSELLQRKVEFRRVSFRVFPPSVQLADVRIANDPRLGGDPFLSAEELTIGGGLSIGHGELRFGRVRAVAPRLSLVQFPDGTWNLPPGLTRPATKEGGGGLEVRFGELVIQQGVFEIEGRRAGIDAKMEDFAVEIVSRPNARYRADLTCRRVSLALPNAEPLVFRLDAKFRLDTAHGAWIESVAAAGDFGTLRLAGNLENFREPAANLALSGDLKLEELERIFRAELGFSGGLKVRGQISTAPRLGFRVTGRVSSPRVLGGNFPLEDFEATLTARADSLLARIDRARYAGGEATGSLRIDNLDKARGPVASPPAYRARSMRASSESARATSVASKSSSGKLPPTIRGDDTRPVRRKPARGAVESWPRTLTAPENPSSARNTRSSSLAFCRRVVWSQLETTSDSGSRSSAARLTGVTVSSRRARCSTKASIRSGSGSDTSIGSSVGTTRSYRCTATAW